jgi:hypothetical protein
MGELIRRVLPRLVLLEATGVAGTKLSFWEPVLCLELIEDSVENNDDPLSAC